MTKMTVQEFKEHLERLDRLAEKHLKWKRENFGKPKLPIKEIPEDQLPIGLTRWFWRRAVSDI